MEFNEESNKVNKINAFFLRLNHCFEILRAKEYVFINIKNTGKQGEMTLNTLNLNRNDVHELFSAWLITDLHDKYGAEQVSNLMKEVNKRG